MEFHKYSLAKTTQLYLASLETGLSTKLKLIKYKQERARFKNPNAMSLRESEKADIRMEQKVLDFLVKLKASLSSKEGDYVFKEFWLEALKNIADQIPANIKKTKKKIALVFADSLSRFKNFGFAKLLNKNNCKDLLNLFKGLVERLEKELRNENANEKKLIKIIKRFAPKGFAPTEFQAYYSKKNKKPEWEKKVFADMQKIARSLRISVHSVDFD